MRRPAAISGRVTGPRARRRRFVPLRVLAGLLLLTGTAGCAPDMMELTAAPVPTGAAGGWNMALDDEFDGSTLQSTVWRTCSDHCAPAGSQSLSLNEPDNLQVRDGSLTLTARRQPVTGADHRAYPYTGAAITTRSSYRFQSGFVEVRMRSDAGPGLWPAVWVAPADGPDPLEIDAVEQSGGQPGFAWLTYRYPAGKRPAVQRSTTSLPGGISAWHTYGVDIEPDAITWYVDGTVRQKVTALAQLGALGGDLYLILDLAVAAPSNAATAAAPFPRHMDVDYVRAWRGSADGT